MGTRGQRSSSGVWHPKFLIGFIKIFYLIWGGYLNFLLKGFSLSKYFFLWQVFCFGFTQGLILVLEVFPSYVDSKPNAFHLGNFFWKIFLNSPMAFGMILSPFSKSLLPWHEWKSPPKSLSPSLDHDMLQIQRVEPLHIFIPFYFLSKLFLPSILALGDLQRSYPFCFEFCLQTNFPS